MMTDYERCNRVIGPVVRMALSWLLGWRYDGSGPARWRLVDRRPASGAAREGEIQSREAEARVRPAEGPESGVTAGGRVEGR